MSLIVFTGLDEMLLSVKELDPQPITAAFQELQQKNILVKNCGSLLNIDIWVLSI